MGKGMGELEGEGEPVCASQGFPLPPLITNMPSGLS